MSQPLPLPIQTMYAELAERAQLGQMAEEFDPAGSFIKRTIGGREYWYFRSPMTEGSGPEKYAGPDSPELADRIARHRTEKSGYKERRTLVSALIREAPIQEPAGYSRPWPTPASSASRPSWSAPPPTRPIPA
jgi:hypothetical protein